MKLDELMTHAATVKVEGADGWGEKVVATFDEGDLPEFVVEYDFHHNGNTRLKMTALVDDNLPEGTEGRKVEVCLFSDASIEAFFGLTDLVREMVKRHRSVPPSPPLELPF